MELTHSFTVPASKEVTWAAFSDLTSVAECFPGAAVTAVDGDDFEGTCKVKLGPIALVYAGRGSFTERDEAAGRLVLDATGKDKRGNGTAGAHVTATLTPDGTGTKVEVVTDLKITGKPAQFGRGVIQDVSDRLLQQFVECLESKVAVEEQQPERVPLRPRETDQEDEALDVGAALLPVLLKSFWKQAVVAVVVLVMLRRLLGRRQG